MSGEGKAGTAFARWYEGTVSFSQPRLDPSLVDPRLGSINGRSDEAYVNTSTDGPAASVFSADDVNDWVYLTLEYTYSLSNGAHELRVEIVGYFEDGFEFRPRSCSIGARAGYTGELPGFPWANHLHLIGRPDAISSMCTRATVKSRRWNTR